MKLLRNACALIAIVILSGCTAQFGVSEAPRQLADGSQSGGSFHGVQLTLGEVQTPTASGSGISVPGAGLVGGAIDAVLGAFSFRVGGSDGGWSE